MDSFQSRMNPRFLAESEMGTLWEPRIIESGRETVEGFKEDEKGKRKASVLSSFNLSWFSVVHVFMSSVHALSSLVRLVTLLRGADFWSCVSSAKSWWFTEWLASIPICHSKLAYQSVNQITNQVKPLIQSPRNQSTNQPSQAIHPIASIPICQVKPYIQ